MGTPAARATDSSTASRWLHEPRPRRSTSERSNAALDSGVRRGKARGRAVRPPGPGRGREQWAPAPGLCAVPRRRTRWVHLRTCLTCGNTGCCDSSRGKHAWSHAESTGHAVARSAETGEEWAWCYEDHVFLRPAAPGARGSGASLRPGRGDAPGRGEAGGTSGPAS
ncbi:UBP-type zinc finger domain-containing protein [Streptomyces sp. H27-S2]|uniref:UBP-type zinc finger domain-containing protein n=1 Tax=Streptomyces antarcticus TaxID=2996458 RepID=UPI0022718966|nr:UBP-type zinc finger domain-containing protein [Streptomyces sp. H27-S2]MCY0949761.1 UBP-type zinc finger domain-containing protein [Streptomyces sp. H27-S2]